MKPYHFLALLSMLFAGLTAVIAKAGLKNLSADAGLAIRTCFVFVFVWGNVLLFRSGDKALFSAVTPRDVLFLGISALTTSLSWIFYYRAIKVGQVSEVALIDKGSILITLLLSGLFLHEQFTLKMLLSIALICAGLLLLVWK